MTQKKSSIMNIYNANLNSCCFSGISVVFLNNFSKIRNYSKDFFFLISVTKNKNKNVKALK